MIIMKVFKIWIFVFVCFIALYVGMKVREGIEYRNEKELRQEVISKDHHKWEGMLYTEDEMFN